MSIYTVHIMKPLAFLLPLLILTTSADFFHHVDYCSLSCSDGTTSSGCNCSPIGGREIYLLGQVDLRKTVVTVINAYRNKIAKGDYRKKGFPTAANMMVVNYDLELEHLARCFILNKFKNGRSHYDLCRKTSYCINEQPGQSLIEVTFKSSSMQRVREFLNAWFNEWKFIPFNHREVLISSYNPLQSTQSYSDFTQMIWASIVRVGCIRGGNPLSENLFKFVMICNFAGLDHQCAGNVRSRPIYEIGVPCSKCGDVRCNNLTKEGRYEALCGELREVPEEEPVLPWLERERTEGTEDPMNFVVDVEKYDRFSSGSRDVGNLLLLGVAIWLLIK